MSISEAFIPKSLSGGGPAGAGGGAGEQPIIKSIRGILKLIFLNGPNVDVDKKSVLDYYFTHIYGLNYLSKSLL